jgi:hypothetical protein
MNASRSNNDLYRNYIYFDWRRRPVVAGFSESVEMNTDGLWHVYLRPILSHSSHSVPFE